MMKSKLTGKYMIVFSISVLMVIVVWLAMVYCSFYYDKGVDESHPQYLIYYFEKYIDEPNMTINEKGKQILSKNNIWAQIIDGSGKVIEEYNVSDGTPDSYDIFSMSYYVLNSNAVDNQTVFVRKIYDDNDYGIVLGCDSSYMSKISLKVKGGITDVIIKTILILVGVFIIVGIGAGLYFSKNISTPVNEIIKNINKLENEETCEQIENNNKVFSDVFESLENLRERLVSADNARKHAENQRNEWISNISHDMKSPLSSIMGYAEIMTYENIVLSEEDRDVYCNKIYKHAEALNELVEELKFSRLLENGEINLHMEEFDICEVLDECISNSPSNYDISRIKCEYENDKMYVFADRNLLYRCFANIICNAVIHNNYDVDIIVRCRRCEKVIIEIEDNGKGIAEEDIHKVFTRYYRGEATEEIAGSGLGLAIAADIIKSHDGVIEVESELGKGTKFIIKL